MQKFKQFLPVAVVALGAVVSSSALGETIKWNKGAAEKYYWHDAANWDLGRVPQDGDDVQLASSWDGYSYNNCYLTNATAKIKSLTLGRRRRLVVTGWESCISAETITIQGGGTPGATTDACIYAPSFADGAMSNRIWIVADKMTIYGGSSSGYLYALGYAAKAGPAWDGVTLPASGQYAGSHGGLAYDKTGRTYGSVTEPTAPGSGGNKYVGGGAIRLEVKELVNNGTISATYDGGAHENEGSRGSGGSVWVTCETLSGSGVIRADGGGHYFTSNPEKAGTGVGGGGGRIAIDYDAEKQKLVDCQVVISARGGVDWNGTGQKRHEALGWSGTVCLPDDQFLKRPGMKLSGVIYTGSTPTRLTAAAFADYLAANSALTNCCFEFAEENAMLVHAGDLSFAGGTETRGNGLRFTGSRPTVSISGDVSLDHAAIRFENGGDLSVGGDLTLAEATYPAQSAEVYVIAAPTNETTASYGATVAVGGTWTVGAKSSFIPVCDPTNGSIVAASARNFVLRPNGEVNADGRGWGAMKGPGRPSAYTGSASYGGKGGALSAGHAYAAGAVYGDRRKPLDPGSGSRNSNSNGGAQGGGVVYLCVDGRLTVDGVISANGKDGGAWTSASSGGSVLLKTHRLCASAGKVTATGGVPSDPGRGGCGGGGRVAIYYGEDETDAAFHENVTAKGGYYTGKAADDAYQGHDGSVYWHPVRGLMLLLR